MKINAFYIALSLLLTLAVNDYLWIDLLEDDTLAIELEKEEKEESREELRESKAEELKQNTYLGDRALLNHSFSSQNLASGIIKHGNSFCPMVNSHAPKLYTLYCQLKLYY